MNALEIFEETYEIRQLFTKSSLAKIHYYRGMTRIELAKEDGSTERVFEAFTDFAEVRNVTDEYNQEMARYEAMAIEVMNEADESLLKMAKKEKILEEKLVLLDERIALLYQMEPLEGVANIEYRIGETSELAGDLLFDDATFDQMQQSQKYYQQAVEQFELARYDDPFNKGLIRKILDLARKQDDADRVKEYNKLLEIAGG